MRFNKRKNDELRPIFLGPNFAKYAEGSCFVKYGDTHVICTATIEDRVPLFLRNTGSGWITAEYGMLPRSTHDRHDREAARGGQSGRTQEIQRLIGRTLRSATDLSLMGERQIRIDCDVLQADGGTRTASITGAYVALRQALQRLIDKRLIKEMPLKYYLSAVSCGIVKGEVLLDLDYAEDSSADVDANFIMTDSDFIIETQVCSEKNPYTHDQYMTLFHLAQKGVRELIDHQKKIFEK